MRVVAKVLSGIHLAPFLLISFQNYMISGTGLAMKKEHFETTWIRGGNNYVCIR